MLGCKRFFLKGLILRNSIIQSLQVEKGNWSKDSRMNIVCYLLPIAKCFKVINFSFCYLEKIFSIEISLTLFKGKEIFMSTIVI